MSPVLHFEPRTLLPVPLLSPLTEQGEKDDKIIAVHADDPEFAGFTDIKQLPPHRLLEIRR